MFARKPPGADPTVEATAPASPERGAAALRNDTVRCEAHGTVDITATVRAAQTVRDLTDGKLDVRLDLAAANALDSNADIRDRRQRGLGLDVPERYCPKFLQGATPRQLLAGIERTVEKMEALDPSTYFGHFTSGTIHSADLQNVRFVFTEDGREVFTIRPVKDLGSGGQGSVSLVELTRVVDGETRSDLVAMKCMKNGELAEREAANMMRGSEISRLVPPVLYAFGVEGGRKVIIMPYLEGQPLGDFSERVSRGLSDLPEVVSITRQLVRDGKELADAGLLPGDTHAWNILVHPLPGEPSVRFIDYTLAGEDTEALVETTRDFLDKLRPGGAATTDVDAALFLSQSGISEFAERTARLWDSPSITLDEIRERLETVENLLAQGHLDPVEVFDRAGLPRLD